jgi:hypothetical protein
VHRNREAFERRGATVLAIGQGTGAEAAEVAREVGVTIPVLGDPGKASYRTIGLGRAGWWGLLVQPMIENLLESFENLRRASLRWSASPRSDVRQLGGVMIVDGAGTIRYLHRSRSTTDVPPTPVLLAALDELAHA